MLEENDVSWQAPIFFISNGAHSKLITTLEKKCNIVNFSKPLSKDMLLLIQKICKAEKMGFESVDVGMDLISYVQNDYRKLISTLQDLKQDIRKKVITSKLFKEFTEINKKKDMDVHIFDAVAEMMKFYSSINECLRLYECEKTIIPLVMHQNFVKIVYDNCGQNELNVAGDIAKSIAIGDVVEQYIHNDQSWDLQKIHGFLTCAYPAFRLSDVKIAATKWELTKYMAYPLDLNRTSIRKINNKNIINSSNYLKNLGIADFIYLNDLIKKLISDEKYKECADLSKELQN